MTDQPRSSNALLIAGILLIAINLRPALASVGPLVEDIRGSTGLSSLQLGLLTTLPLIAFGVCSTLTPLLTRRFGIGATLLGAMGLTFESDAPFAVRRAQHTIPLLGSPAELYAAVAQVLAFVISRRSTGARGGEHLTPRQAADLPAVPVAGRRRRSIEPAATNSSGAPPTGR